MNVKSPEELMLSYKYDSPDKAILAFNELYGRFAQRVYNYLNSKTKNAALSDDLLQKVFIKVHESKHLFNPNYKFEQWIFVIARSAVLDSFRSEKRYQDRLSKYDNADRAIPEEEEVQTQVFQDLADDQMELLEMKYVDELSYNEIALILKKSETSLRKSVSRITAKIRGK